MTVLVVLDSRRHYTVYFRYIDASLMLIRAIDARAEIRRG